MNGCIAVITTANTKLDELCFVRDELTSNGMGVLTVDISTKDGYSANTDITPVEVLRYGGYTRRDLETAGSKAACIEIMTMSLKKLIPALYEEGRIRGAFGFGGWQNTLMISTALQQLPYGVPKVLLSTVATGSRTCGALMGVKDIVLVPSVADIAGVNVLTEMSLRTGCAAITGLMQHMDGKIEIEEKVIAATMMGVNNDGIARAVEQVQAHGLSVVTFHSTGVGGAAMEQLIRDGKISAVMDLSLHEITSEEVFGGGFSAGARGRLCAAAEMGIPMVVCPGGLDFVDYNKTDFLHGAVGDPSKRKHTFHNADTIHVKLNCEEAEQAAVVVAERLNAATGLVTLVLPERGLRTETRPGEKLYDPEVDRVIFDTLKARLKPSVRVIALDAHIDDEAFSSAVSQSLFDSMGEK